MYTWGYIKEATLAKLDLTQDDSYAGTLLERFSYFANEAITQICSSVKPRCAFYEVMINGDPSKGDVNLGRAIEMPSDFVSFGDDVNWVAYTDEYGMTICREAHDDDFAYLGYNRIICKREGAFQISYNARWVRDFRMLDDSAELDVPADILDCLPSYIASQCLKIDDEYKSSVYRNEYEMFLARIDETNYKNTKTFKIEGDW